MNEDVALLIEKIRIAALAGRSSALIRFAYARIKRNVKRKVANQYASTKISTPSNNISRS